ncbi:MAG: hypothetical protein ACR2GY_01815 [Phycisphaerales bacterium]
MPTEPKPGRKRGAYRTRGKTDAAIISAIVEAQVDLNGLAEAGECSLEQLAAWIATVDHRQTLQALSDLADTCTQMLVNRYRAAAAARLFELANQDDPKMLETARKACVDLLRADLNPPPVEDSERAGDHRRTSAGNDARILASLERLGTA